MVVPACGALHPAVLQELHEGKPSGHSGTEKTACRKVEGTLLLAGTL